MTEPAAERPTARQTFAGWHREPSLYREIYTRTISALIAALIIYVTAALLGYVSREPLLPLALIVTAASFVLVNISKARTPLRLFGALLVIPAAILLSRYFPPG